MSKIFSKEADDGNSTADTPQQQADHTADSIPTAMQPGRTKYIPRTQPNVIEDEEGMRPTNFQRKVQKSPSGPHIIPH